MSSIGTLSLLAAPQAPQRIEEWGDQIAAISWVDVAFSIAVLLLAAALGALAHLLSFRALRVWAKRTESILDDAVVTHLKKPLRWLFPIIAVSLATKPAALPEGTVAFARHTGLVIVIILVARLIIGVVRVFEDVVEHRYDVRAEDNLRARQIHTQMRGLRNIAVFLVSLLAFAFVLMTFEKVRQLGTSLLASAGVAGVVIGFAAQRSIATIVAGVQIAFTQPIRVDDVVIVENEWGWIEEITLTYVVVRIWDLRRLVVPITYFIEKPFQNWTRVSADLLGTVEVYADYGVSVDSVREELKRIVEASDHWDGKVCGLQVTDASERTIKLRALVSSADSGKGWDLRCEVREKLVAFLEREHGKALPKLRTEVSREAA